MQKIFFTPGPSQLYPTVSQHIKTALAENIPSISHRGDKFHEIFQNTQNLLRKLLKIPNTHKIFFLSSGTEAMERIIENTVEKYSLHFVNGAFSARFYQTAVELGKKPLKITAKPGEGFYMDRLDLRHLEGDRMGSFQVEELENVELICITHNETSTGVTIPFKLIDQIKKRFKNQLLAVDTVSSTPGVDFDYATPDLTFFSVQKGFGLPAGLGVLIVSPQALKKSAGSYHSFDSLLKYLEKFETPETPNVLAIYLLGKVCHDMTASARHCLAEIRKETEQKAKMIYDFFERKKGFKIFVRDNKFRSNTVIVIEVDGGSKFVLDKLKQQGFIVGSGYGEFKEKHIRIANFPAVTVADVKLLLHYLDSS